MEDGQTGQVGIHCEKILAGDIVLSDNPIDAYLLSNIKPLK